MIKAFVENRVMRLAVLAVIAFILAIVFLVINSHQNVMAAGASDAGVQSYTFCTPTEVGVFTSPAPGRVHVKCSAGVTDGSNTIYYWAYPANDAAAAARYQSLFSTAMATGKQLTIFYKSGDTSGSAWGCGSSDCRVIYGATMP